MDTNYILPDEVLQQMKIIDAVVDNYNEHKSEKNKELTVSEAQILAFVPTPMYEEFLVVTGRNDGLMYSVQFENVTGKVTLFLYNRIARKVLSEGTPILPAEPEGITE